MQSGSTGRATLLLIMLAATILFSNASAWADIAPPEQPPGSNISPGGETQVTIVSPEIHPKPD